jgi:hypothetical protein
LADGDTYNKKILKDSAIKAGKVLVSSAAKDLMKAKAQ